MIWVAYGSLFSALVPLAALILLRRDLPSWYWIVGIAWLTSVAQDATAMVDGGTWLNTQLWPVLTFTLLVLAVSRAWYVAVLLAVVAWTGLGSDGPNVWLPLLGSLAVLYHVRGAMVAPMVWYCGLGTMAYVGYAMTLDTYWLATAFWFAHKAATMTAYALLILSAMRYSQGEIHERT